MKRERLWLLGMLCWIGAGAASTPTLTGRVFLGFQGLTPAPKVKVSLGGINPARTDDSGVFVLSLPPSTQPGARIKLELSKLGFCIWSPFNGEVVVPDDRGDTRPIEVRLLRSDSKQSNTEDCMARFIDAVAGKPRTPTPSAQNPAPLDLPRELKQWAERQGVQLTEEQAGAALTRWLGEVKAQPNRDPHTLGLARFAEKRFAEARKLFLQAAEEGQRQIERAREQVALNYRLAGDAAREDLNFGDALVEYEKALAQVSRMVQPTQWAALQIYLGITHEELGVRIAPENSASELAKAVFCYRLALQIYTREQLPQYWAN